MGASQRRGSIAAAGMSHANTAYAAAVLADNPISYWKMDEPSGTNAVDYGSANLAGTYTNSPTLGVAGPLTGVTAVTFASASTQYMNRADAAAYDVGDVVTLEAWVKRANAASDHAVLSMGAGSAYMRVAATTNTIQWIRSQNSLMCTSTGPIGNGVWTHVAVTKNGATLKIYINGVDVTGAVTNSTLVNPTVPTRVGSDTTAGSVTGDLMNGSIGQAAIYGTALSAARIAAHFAAAS